MLATLILPLTSNFCSALIKYTRVEYKRIC